jgi:AcrR family transcriptional regulator
MTIKRERILEQACDLYLTDGLEGFSMRKLARRVGVTAPALYRYYEGKEAVLVDVVGEAYKLFGQYLYRALGVPTPEERFQRAGQEYLEFALEHPRMYEMLFTTPEAIGLEELPEEIAVQACAIGQFWKDRVREAVDAGFIKPFEIEAISQTLWAHAHGLVSIYHRGFIPVSEEEFRTLFRESGMRMLLGLATGEHQVRMGKMLEEEQAQLTA